MGIKERRTKLLLLLFLFSNPELSSVTINERLQLIFDISLNQKTKGIIRKMIDDKLVTQVEKTKDADIQLSLTENGFQALCLEFPFFRFLRQEWDGKWRILSYEIPEKKRDLRDRLRREVAGWGLGPWHRSFWVTPHPIIPSLSRLVSHKEEEKYIQCFEATHEFGDRSILIDKVWATATLEKEYRAMFKVWHDVLSGTEDKGVKMTKIMSEYIEKLRMDPGLPKELVGEKWIGYEAYTIFKEVRSILMG